MMFKNNRWLCGLLFLFMFYILSVPVFAIELESDFGMDNSIEVMDDIDSGLSEEIAVDDSVNLAVVRSIDMHSNLKLRSARGGYSNRALVISYGNNRWSVKSGIYHGIQFGWMTHTGDTSPYIGRVLIESREPSGVVRSHLSDGWSYNGYSSNIGLYPYRYVHYNVISPNQYFSAPVGSISGKTRSAFWWTGYFDIDARYVSVGSRGGAVINGWGDAFWGSLGNNPNVDENGWFTTDYYDDLVSLYYVYDDDASNKQILSTTPGAESYDCNSMATFTDFVTRCDIKDWSRIYDSNWNWIGESTGAATRDYMNVDMGCLGVSRSDTVGTNYALKYLHVSAVSRTGKVLNMVTRVPPAYRITYDTHGAVYDPYPSEYVFTGYDRNVTTYIPIKQGYEFLGWYTQPNGNGTKYDSGQLVNMTSNLHLHAHWKKIPELRVTVEILMDDVTNQYWGCAKSLTCGSGDLANSSSFVQPSPWQKNNTITYKRVISVYEGADVECCWQTFGGSSYNGNTNGSFYDMLSYIEEVYIDGVPQNIQNIVKDAPSIDRYTYRIIDGITYKYDSKDISFQPGGRLYRRYSTGIEEGRHIFSNVTKDHTITVLCKPYNALFVEIKSGSRANVQNPAPDKTAGLYYKRGETLSLRYVPQSGNVIKSVVFKNEYMHEREAEISVLPSLFPDEYFVLENVGTKQEYLLYNSFFGGKKYFTDKGYIHARLTIETEPGYNIYTSVVNGTISDSVKGIRPGKSSTVSYSPNDGYYLTQLLVNGSPVSLAGMNSSRYTFANINRDHTIRAVFSKGHNIRTRVVNGNIKGDGLSLAPGSSYTVDYSGYDEHYLKSIKVDGVLQDLSKYKDAFTFSNIQTDHLIEVEYAPYWWIGTTVENGVITPRIGNLQSGASAVVRYSPDENCYLERVWVDGSAVNLTTYVSSYSFTNIQANHVVDVRYLPYHKVITSIEGGTITATKDLLRHDSKHTVTWRPSPGWYVDSVKIIRYGDDGSNTVVSGYDSDYCAGNRAGGSFELNGVDANYSVNVVCKPYLSVTTKITNGTITPTVTGLLCGSSRHVEWSSVNNEYIVVSVVVDGEEQRIADADLFGGSIDFNNMTESHVVEVVCRPKYKITTSITNGMITPTITGITPGSSQTVTYTPDDDHYVESVTVDGVVLSVSELALHLTSYVFTNIHEDHTITVVCKPYCHLNTYVRWRDVNGNWSAYEKVDTATKKQGESYSYTWVRGQLKTEPENVYFDGNPKTVGDTNLSVSKDYYIDVERKQYTYTFDMNPPDGYAVIGIGNQQENLVDKWAETVSGNVKSPSLTGYTFLGWNTKKDGTGQAYMSESMLSNKTFYARWRKNKYKIHYDANGSSNPNHQTGEFTQNTVLGVMADSQYEYDTRGMLRTNAFTRSGYEFLGWNTKADGTGLAYGESAYDVSNKLYSDGYANVWNMTTGDNVTLTLYAQWKKKLGSEVLTVLSEETGNPVANVKVKLYQKTNGTWNERTDVGTLTTNSNGQVRVRNLHWFAYEWRCVSVPDGYQKLSDVAFTVKHDALDWRHEVVLYLRRVQIVCQSQVSAIISGERAPSFVYQVSGTDAAGVRHSYMIEVPVSAGTKRGTSKALSCYAGTYTVTQIPVSRYVPGNARNVQNFTVSSISGTTNLLTKEKGEVLFPYMLRQYEGFGSVDMKENQFSSDLVEIRSFRDFIQQLFVN